MEEWLLELAKESPAGAIAVAAILAIRSLTGKVNRLDAKVNALMTHLGLRVQTGPHIVPMPPRDHVSQVSDVSTVHARHKTVAP